VRILLRKSCSSHFKLVFPTLLALGLCLTVAEATEYFVAVNHPGASDDNDGLSLGEPFKTLGRGAQLLSPGDTLTIQEGIYREKLQLDVDGSSSNPIVIRAHPGEEGRVVIRGSNLVTGWSNDGGNVWSVPWDPLPLLDYPSSYPNVDEYARRREIVVIDGNQQQQVFSAAELVDGSFWMDDAAGRLRIHLAGDPNVSEVEIAVRDRGVFAPGKSHVTVRGIRVEHVSTEIWQGALALGNYGRVEDCRLEFNNGYGISMESDAVILRTVVNYNGRTGINLVGSSDSLIESSETSYNSWRYGPGWDCGGINIVSIGTASGNRIVRHTARYNNGSGIFLDTVNSGNVIEASVLEGNVIYEIHIEAAIGPNWIVNNLLLNTDNYTYEVPSIRLLVARDTHIYNNTVVNEGGSCIFITGVERYSGSFHYYAANTRVFNNILSVHPGPRAIDFGVSGLSGTQANIESHHFDNNLYYGADPMMWLSGPYTLAEWQAIRGEDLNSISAPPMFSNPAAGDYSLRYSSPAIDAGQELPEVSQDIMGTPRPSGLATDIGAYEWVDADFIFGSGFETGDMSDWQLGS
jgi:hypothetical protein